MTHSLPARPAADGPTDPEVAAAPAPAIDALQAGRPFDRAGLLARHPELEGALAGLEQLFCPPTTVAAGEPVVSVAVALPERIGPYQVERELGAGGFGVVYLAFDPDVKRRVALKVL